MQKLVVDRISCSAVSSLSLLSKKLHKPHALPPTYGCVRLASLGRPWTAPSAFESFDAIPGAHPGQPQCPACGVGH